MFSPNGIRYILFDLDGTLRHSQPSFNQTFIDFTLLNNLEVNETDRLRALRWLHRYWAQSAELLSDLETFRDRQDLFWTNHARQHLIAAGCQESQAVDLAPALYAHMEDRYHPEDWVPPEVPECLDRLLARGYRLAVVSNRNHSYHELLAALGLDRYFDFSLAAGEVNAWKPQPEIFLHALDRLGASPVESVYVGDNYYADVLGARQAGMEAVLLDPEGIFPEADCPVIQSLAGLDVDIVIKEATGPKSPL